MSKRREHATRVQTASPTSSDLITPASPAQTPEQTSAAPLSSRHTPAEFQIHGPPTPAEGGERVGSDLSASLTSALHSGQPLAPDLRSQAEGDFGADFSTVRVHTDATSGALSESLSARAFTVGQDVFFGQGEFAPSASRGQELLAHELTHVVQQSGSAPAQLDNLALSAPGDSAEQEATAVAQRVAAGEPASVGGMADYGVQRSLLDDFVLGAKNIYHDVAETVGVESPDEAEAARLQAFIDHGLFGPQALVPPTNIGGFDASFEPSLGMLLIEVRTGVNFIHGLTIDTDGTVTSNHDDLAQAATDAMNLPVEDRPAFVEQFTWQAADEGDFTDKLQQRVEDAWGGQFSFFCTRLGWETMVADVAVDIDVHKGDAGADDHLQSTVYKVPTGGTYSVGAFVDSDRDGPGFRDQDPHNNLVVMSSTDVDETPLDQSLLRKTIEFGHDSAEIDADGLATISAFAADFRDANLDLSNPVQLEGHASASGSEEYNTKLAQKRINAVRKALSDAGFTGIDERVSTLNMGEEGATEDPEWRRVDLIVGSGEGQLVAAHEFGHVFGLADEYVSSDKNPGGSISGSGLAVGQIAEHDAMARAIGTDGAIGENNDSILSLGNTVRPQHYATFGWALSEITGISEWQVV